MKSFSIRGIGRQFGTLCCSVLLMLSIPAMAGTSNEKANDHILKATPLRVVFFFSPTCGNCQDAKVAIAEAKRRWSDRIAIEQKDISQLEVFTEMFGYEDHYGSDEPDPPKIFIGNQYIAGSKVDKTLLFKVIEAELAAGSITFVPATEAESQPSEDSAFSEVLARFESFSAGAVAVAGLIDGINPCAFTTIIFLISMLAYMGKTRRQLAIVGVGFTAAVFVTYLLLGLGMLGAIKAFSVSHGISKVFAYIVAGLTFFLAGWSFLDFVRFKRSGDIKDATLGLPKSIKAKIHKVIRTGLNTKSLLAGAIGVGVLVAILESLCTGQVYLPTIVFVSRAESLRTDAVGYLVLYNAMFIAPLIGVFGLAYWGVGSQQLGCFLQSHLAMSKLLMGCGFLILALLVIATV